MKKIFEVERNDFLVSSDPEKLDRDLVYRTLRELYWARQIPKEIVERSIDNSLCFGVYQDGKQLGFVRVITDYATFAYLSDVFILESHRRRGLSKLLTEVILQHPELKTLRRWHLVTHDAQKLYEKYGFRRIEHQERHMEIVVKDAYL